MGTSHTEDMTTKGNQHWSTFEGISLTRNNTNSILLDLFNLLKDYLAIPIPIAINAPSKQPGGI